MVSPEYIHKVLNMHPYQTRSELAEMYRSTALNCKWNHDNGVPIPDPQGPDDSWAFRAYLATAIAEELERGA